MNRDNQEAFETFEFNLPPIRGFPELRWAGKRPFKSTQYFPAQKKESYGDPTDGWWNRIYWGDNLQVMSHLLREFRGKVDLIYIDPPFDSKADYKKTIEIKSKSATTDALAFEEKQYTDIWTEDGYLQFMSDRLSICRELLSEDGAIYVHVDPKKVHFIRSIMDEIFLPGNFRNEIIWDYSFRMMDLPSFFNRKHDNILFYAKSESHRIKMPKEPWTKEDLIKSRKQEIITDEDGVEWISMPGAKGNSKARLEKVEDLIAKGKAISDVWKISTLSSSATERTGYPTQKPSELIARIIEASSPEGGLVFDCFMGSGTTQSAAMAMGRRFIGADINLAAIETTCKRLNDQRLKARGRSSGLFGEDSNSSLQAKFAGFEVYNVNNYDLFRNPVEAEELIREAMELQPLPPSSVFDGQRESYLVKIMPVNRIATRQDLNEVINGLDFKAFERRQAEAPNKPVERIHLVCMGHEPDLGPQLVKAAKPFDIEVMVTDLVRDKAHLHFKKSSDARLAIEGGELVIAGFYPMNLLQKLSLEPGTVEDWRQLVESVKVDFNYDGAVLTPAIVDAPGKSDLVVGRYAIPADAATIRVKITDLISESWEGEIDNG